MDCALQFEGVAKVYRSWGSKDPVHALRDFSLSVERGEIFGFLGPNGAGKTTAIHIALGFVHVSSGSGRMLGKPFGDVRTRRRVGFLAESVAFCNTTVERGLGFYGGLNAIAGSDLAYAVADAVVTMQLKSESGRRLSQLSRGMLQRVGLAQAVVNDPDLIILDEPTSALDPAARVAVRELLIKLRNREKTIFLSSHLLSEVELVCDRVGVLKGGRLVRVGRLSDLLEVTDAVEIVARGLAEGSVSGGVKEGALWNIKVRGSDQRATIERIWNAGGEIVSVNPVRRSLEELFLELTAETGLPQERGTG